MCVKDGVTVLPTDGVLSMDDVYATFFLSTGLNFSSKWSQNGLDGWLLVEKKTLLPSSR